MQSAAATHAPAAQNAAGVYHQPQSSVSAFSFWEYGEENGVKYYHSRNLSCYLFAPFTACLFYLYGCARNYCTSVCMLMRRVMTQIAMRDSVLVFWWRSLCTECENSECGNFYGEQI